MCPRPKEYVCLGVQVGVGSKSLKSHTKVSSLYSEHNGGTTGAKHRRVGQKYHYICVLERLLNGLKQTTLAAGRPIRGVFHSPGKC